MSENDVLFHLAGGVGIALICFFLGRWHRSSETKRLRDLLRRLLKRSELGSEDPTRGDNLWEEIEQAAAAVGEEP